MNCHLEVVFASGKGEKLITEPNGNKDNVYPSRGWATSSAYQWADSFAAKIKKGDYPEDKPVSVDVVLEDGQVHTSIKLASPRVQTFAE